LIVNRTTNTSNSLPKVLIPLFANIAHIKTKNAMIIKVGVICKKYNLIISANIFNMQTAMAIFKRMYILIIILQTTLPRPSSNISKIVPPSRCLPKYKIHRANGMFISTPMSTATQNALPVIDVTNVNVNTILPTILA